MARKGKWDPSRKSGRRRQSHFMDAAMDGYVRDVALRIWRLQSEMAAAPDYDERRAMQEIGAFTTAGPYRPIWQAAWQRHVLSAAGEDETPLFGRIEAAVRDALGQERDARAQRGDATIEDTPDYNEFVDRALGRLLEEASGEIEEMD